MNLRVFEDAGSLVRGTADAVARRIEAGERVAVALSGGSTPKPLYELLGSGEHRRKIERSEVVWILGDERCVPPDHPESNSGMISATLFREGLPRSHRFLRFPTELGDPRKIAETFEREWNALGLNGIDLAILGVGGDGHTASLFPDTEVLAVQDRIAAAVHVPKLNSWRVTLTAPVLRAARAKFILAAGASKRAILDEIRGGASYPVTEVTRGGGETWWFVDREAAGA